jgi:hypothetical protein
MHDTPPGLLTNAVQMLAGVLLPRAMVFLLFHSNDTAALGPLVDSQKLNIFTRLLKRVRRSGSGPWTTTGVPGLYTSITS